MKVYILTEGGKNIGFGHITRCTSLYQAFEENKIEPEFIVLGDNSVENLLNDKRHQRFNWIKEKDILFKIVKNADIVIIDSYLANYEIYARISKLVKTPVYIDDNKRIDYPRGIVVNGTICAEEFNYPNKKNVIYLLGSRYILVRKEFWTVPKKDIKDNIESIMITFGGDDSRNMTPKILKILTKNYPGVNKKVIIGKGFKNVEQIERLKDEKTEFAYCSSATSMKRLILESDVAISACGQTLYELARIGTPTIAVAVADNQLSNAEGWRIAGFIKYIGWWEDISALENVKKYFKLLRSKKLRIKMANIGKSLDDGKGARRVVEEVTKILDLQEIRIKK